MLPVNASNVCACLSVAPFPSNCSASLEVFNAAIKKLVPCQAELKRICFLNDPPEEQRASLHC